MFVTPDNVPISGDEQLEQMFGPGYTTRLIRDSEEDYDIPEEIQVVLDEHGLGKRAFSVTLKSLDENEVSTANGAYVKSWGRAVPTIEWIAKHYGPGPYLLYFKWRGRSEDSENVDKKKVFTETVHFEISQKYQDTYDEFQLQQRIARAKRKNDMVRNAKLSKSLENDLDILTEEGEEKKGQVSPRDYLKQLAEDARMVGMVPAGNGGGGSIKWGELLPLIVTGLPTVLKVMDERRRAEQERFEKFLMLMMNQTNQSSTNLLELVKNQQGPTKGSEMMEEMGRMIMSAIDIKDAISGNKETTADKIFGLIESVAPVLLSMTTMSKAQRETSPAFIGAKAYMSASPEFQELSESPETRVALVKKLDAFYGWEQTDGILDIAGYQRPGECPRLPEQRYPANDPRNSTDHSSAEVVEETVPSQEAEVAGTENPLEGVM